MNKMFGLGAGGAAGYRGHFVAGSSFGTFSDRVVDAVDPAGKG